ncbi:MAG: Xaa-Pro peptidase family protein [Gammaproteobacteria bacterium]|nr:Xaa-Pro peptidase family protein [Gammaproteobacteria bacterium]
MFEQHLQQLRAKLVESGLDVALITDDDSVYYYTGYYDYLHMEFGRPTILIVPVDGESLLITPSIDLNMALENAVVDRVEAWNDGLGNEWREHIPGKLKGASRIAIEIHKMPALVRDYVDSLVDASSLEDLTSLVSAMRMIKSDQELQLARHAGAVANAMMEAGREALADGVAEYEVALATSRAGTIKSAELLEQHYGVTQMSPNTHFLQIMASGNDIIKTHHRASNKVMRHGEPVFLCFCGMTNFHKFKLGFDRTFWIGEIQDKSQEKIYQVALDSQSEALKALRPGVLAEDVHAAYAEVIQSAGYDYPFRCGRGTGFSFLEQPQLVVGDKTVLQPNMVLAVDGSVSTDSFRAQVGDSFILTEDGYEAITAHPKSIDDVIVNQG